MGVSVYNVYITNQFQTTYKWVLLGLRAAPIGDFGTSSAELVQRSLLLLPGELLHMRVLVPPPPTRPLTCRRPIWWVQSLCTCVREL
jgi:hypothetical protein